MYNLVQALYIRPKWKFQNKQAMLLLDHKYLFFLELHPRTHRVSTHIPVVQMPTVQSATPSEGAGRLINSLPISNRKPN